MSDLVHYPLVNLLTFVWFGGFAAGIAIAVIVSGFMRWMQS